MVYNPVVYGLSHPHFRSSVRQYISGCTTVGHSHAEHGGNNHGAAGGTGRGCPQQRSAAASGACPVSRFALLAERDARNRPDNVVELKCVRHRRARADDSGGGPACAQLQDYYSEPDCRWVWWTAGNFGPVENHP